VLRPLALLDWPAADREAWLAASHPRERLRRGGLAAHLKPITQNDLERRYGYFLQHLREEKLLGPQAAAAAQITPDAVERYLARVRPIWSSVTVAQTMWKLVRMASLLAPERDWEWLRDSAKDCEFVANPKSRFDRIVNADVLAKSGIDLIRSARGNPRLRTYWRATLIRDGLMVALMAHHPMRLKNFAALTLGNSLQRIGDRWWVVLNRRDTKSARPDERPVPHHLHQAIAVYLVYARPILLGRREFVIDDKGTTNELLQGPLWVGERGAALSYGAVELAIMNATERAVGKRLSPHDFRRNAATTARFLVGNEPYLASALLQHQDRLVTETYNLTSSFHAGQQFADLVESIAAAGAT
jgi:integrase